MLNQVKQHNILQKLYCGTARTITIEFELYINNKILLSRAQA